MKLRPILIVASLAANVALLAAAANQSPRWSAFLPWKHSATENPTGSSAPHAGAAAVAAADRLDPAEWPALAQGDLPAMAARLKAEGFPVSIQRAILGAMVADKFADRHHALAELVNALPWWSGMYQTEKGAAVIAARQKLQRDEKDAVDDLLGPDTAASDYKVAKQLKSYGPVAEAKRAELDRINSDYDELINQVRTAAQNILLPEDREKIAYLEKEKRADIEKLLTPDELFEYDLRSSSSANSLRDQLVAFKPSEDEFRSLFKLLQQFDAKYGAPSTVMTSEQQRTRADALNKAKSAAQTVLTPDRYTEFQQKTDSSYVQAYNFTSRLQLPDSAATEIVNIQKDSQKRAQAIMSNRALAPEERNAQLIALGADAVSRLTPTLGQDGVTAYRQAGGYWLNNLEHPPVVPATSNPGRK